MITVLECEFELLSVKIVTSMKPFLDWGLKPEQTSARLPGIFPQPHGTMHPAC